MRAGLMVCAAFLALPRLAGAATLVSEAEAARPAAPRPALTRGLTRGPSIELDAPRQAVAAPFRFRLRFAGRGGALVEADSLQVTLLRDPPADLTARLKPGTTAAGVDLLEADAPAGSYDFRVDLRDTAGRSTTEFIRIEVAARQPAVTGSTIAPR